MSTTPLKNTRLLLSWYGDDFSGSADVLEVLAQAGIRAELYLDVPSIEQLAERPELQAVGIAGISRSLPVAAMTSELAPAFAAIARLGARLFHYKVCSTADSSPAVGSIGHALDLGQATFESTFIPILIGAPPLGRYCVFGNLFARGAGDGTVFRLDRHPVMSRHPVTPMGESDLLRLLESQTRRPIGLLDVLTLDGPANTVLTKLNELHSSGNEAILLDVLSNAHLPILGNLIWDSAPTPAPKFVVGSSAVEYALVAYWRRKGSLPPRDTPLMPADGPILVISGSCSSTTSEQIHEAVRLGFRAVPLPPEAWARRENIDAPTSIVGEILRVLRRGESVILHAADGPDDPRIERTRQLLSAEGGDQHRDELLAAALAASVRRVLANFPVRRLAVAGGDTSGYVSRAIGVKSLEFVAPIAPGSPLCRIGAPSDPLIDGLEITFKGGQVGKSDFFVRVCHGSIDR